LTKLFHETILPNAMKQWIIRVKEKRIDDCFVQAVTIPGEAGGLLRMANEHSIRLPFKIDLLGVRWT